MHDQVRPHVNTYTYIYNTYMYIDQVNPLCLSGIWILCTFCIECWSSCYTQLMLGMGWNRIWEVWWTYMGHWCSEHWQNHTVVVCLYSACESDESLSYSIALHMLCDSNCCDLCNRHIWYVSLDGQCLHTAPHFSVLVNVMYTYELQDHHDKEVRGVNIASYYSYRATC